MRILYVITKASWGGAQRYVYDLATAAKAAGHDVAVAYGEPGLLVEQLGITGVRTIGVPALGRDVRLGKDLSAFFGLLRLLRDEHPDVLHINSSKAGGLGALAARVAGVPHIIFTAHGWAFNEARPAWQRSLIRLLAGLTIGLSHKTICVSEAIAKDGASLPFSRKLVVIRNGVKCEALRPRLNARAGLLPGKAENYWIGMTGELHPTKRTEDAIEAFALIAPKHPQAILVVLGEGQERPKLEVLAKEKGLTGRIFLLGLIPDAPQYFSAFDLFVHASMSEALGYVILEAGCASLPVVATDVGGIPEIVENGVSGILVAPRDPQVLAGAIERMICDPALAARYAEALHAKVLRDFDTEGMVAKTLALYA